MRGRRDVIIEGGDYARCCFLLSQSSKKPQESIDNRVLAQEFSFGVVRLRV